MGWSHRTGRPSWQQFCFFISHLGLEVDCKWLHFSRVVINDMKSLSYLESGHFRRMLNTKFDGCLAIVIEFQRHLQLHFDESHFDSCSNRRPLIQLQFRCFSETGFFIFCVLSFRANIDCYEIESIDRSSL